MFYTYTLLDILIIHHTICIIYGLEDRRLAALVKTPAKQGVRAFARSPSEGDLNAGPTNCVASKFRVLQLLENLAGVRMPRGDAPVERSFLRGKLRNSNPSAQNPPYVAALILGNCHMSIHSFGFLPNCELKQRLTEVS